MIPKSRIFFQRLVDASPLTSTHVGSSLQLRLFVCLDLDHKTGTSPSGHGQLSSGVFGTLSGIARFVNASNLYFGGVATRTLVRARHSMVPKRASDEES